MPVQHDRSQHNLPHANQQNKKTEYKEKTKKNKNGNALPKNRHGQVVTTSPGVDSDMEVDVGIAVYRVGQKSGATDSRL